MPTKLTRNQIAKALAVACCFVFTPSLSWAGETRTVDRPCYLGSAANLGYPWGGRQVRVPKGIKVEVLREVDKTYVVIQLPDKNKTTGKFSRDCLAALPVSGADTLDTFKTLVEQFRQRKPKSFFEMVSANQIVANFKNYKGKFTYLRGRHLPMEEDEAGNLVTSGTITDGELGLFIVKYELGLPSNPTEGAGDANFGMLARVDEVFTGVNGLGMPVMMPVLRAVAAFDTRRVKVLPKYSKVLGFDAKYTWQDK